MADHKFMHQVIPSGFAEDWKMSKIMLEPASLGLEGEEKKRKKKQTNKKKKISAAGKRVGNFWKGDSLHLTIPTLLMTLSLATRTHCHREAFPLLIPHPNNYQLLYTSAVQTLPNDFCSQTLVFMRKEKIRKNVTQLRNSFYSLTKLPWNWQRSFL